MAYPQSIWITTNKEIKINSYDSLFVNLRWPSNVYDRLQINCIYYFFISRLHLNCPQYGQHIVPMLTTILLISKPGEQNCDNIVHHVVDCDNIITIYDKNIVTQYGKNCKCFNNILELSYHMVQQNCYHI